MVVKIHNGTDIGFSYGDREIIFPTKPVLNKRNIIVADQMTLLNKYLKYKGDDYCSLLWDKLFKAHRAIELGISGDELVYIKEIHDIIDVIDIMDIYNFNTTKGGIIAPGDLIEEFTDEIANEGNHYEAQTFSKSEYLELTALAVALKIVVGPICYFLGSNLLICGDKLEYTGFNFIRSSKLFTSPPMVKTLEMIKKLKEQILVTPLIIDKKISSEEVPVYVLAIVAFQRIATATIIRDNSSSHLVKVIFGYAKAKLENKTDTSKVITNKTMSSGGGDEDSAVSVLEGHKGVSDLPIGEIVKANFYVSSIEKIIQHSPDFIVNNVTLKECLEVEKKLEIFHKAQIPDNTMDILSVIFKLTRSPYIYSNLYMENVIKEMAVAYVFLRNIGFPEIATLITSKESSSNMAINSATNRARLSQEDKENLNKYFPTKVINANQTMNTIEIWINDLTVSYIDGKWVSIIDMVPSSNIVVPNLKPLLAKLIITLEENFYGITK